MLLQFLPQGAGARARARSASRRRAGRHAQPMWSQEDDAWVEGRSMIETVEDLELIDPALSSERLVYRLFHERGVRVFKQRADRGAMLVLARRRRGDAAELLAGRPRPHGRERRDLGDLRVLQRQLPVRAGRCPARGRTANPARQSQSIMIASARRMAAVIAVMAAATAHSAASRSRAKLPGAARRCQAAGAGHRARP